MSFSNSTIQALEKKNIKKYFKVIIDNDVIPRGRVQSYGFSSNKDFASDQLSLVLDNRDKKYSNKSWYNSIIELYEGTVAGGQTETIRKFYGYIRQVEFSHSGTVNTVNLTAFDILIRLAELEIEEKFEAPKTKITLETPTPNFIAFYAKINGAPTATSIIYDNVASESTLQAGDTLYNVTNSYSERTVVSIDTDTSTITTTSSADSWVNNDEIVKSTRVQVLDLANTNVADFPEPIIKVKNRDDELEDPLWEGFQILYEQGQILLGKPLNWAEYLVRCTYYYYPTSTSLYAEDVIEDILTTVDGYGNPVYTTVDNLTETLSNMTGSNIDTMKSNTEAEVIDSVAYDIGQIWYNSYSNILTSLTASDFAVSGGASIDSVDLRYGRIILDSAIDVNATVQCLTDYSFKTLQCVDKDTEALTKNGWKKYNELKIGDEILTLNIDNEKSEWNSIDKLNINNYRGDMVYLKNRSFDALVTPNHKWATKGNRQAYHSPKKKKINLLETKCLKNHYIVRNAPNYDNKKPYYSDTFVKLLGWYITEGSLYKYKYKNNKKIGCITITQSIKKYFKEIKKTLDDLNIKYKINYRYNNKSIADFKLTGEIVNKIIDVFSSKKITSDFIFKLTLDQKKIFYEILIKGDGSYLNQYCRNKVFYTTELHNVDMFQLLCALIGYSTTISIDKREGKRIINNNIANINKKLYCVRILNGKNVRFSSLKKEVIKYDDIIWCPSVKNQTWLMRRNGKVTFTGNSSGIQLTKIEFTYEDTANRLEAINRIRNLCAPNFCFQTLGSDKIWLRYLYQKDTANYTAKNIINLNKAEDLEVFTRVRLFGQNSNPENILYDPDVSVVQDTSEYYSEVTNQELDFVEEKDSWRIYDIGLGEGARIISNYEGYSCWPVVYVNNIPIDDDSHELLMQQVEWKRMEEYKQECHSWCTKFKIRSFRKYWIYFSHSEIDPDQPVILYNNVGVIIKTFDANDSDMNYGEGYYYRDVGEGDAGWIESISTASYYIRYSTGKLEILWSEGKFKVHTSMFSSGREDLVTATFIYSAIYTAPGGIDSLIDGRYTTQVQTEFNSKPSAGFVWAIIDLGSVKEADALDLIGGFFYPDNDQPSRRFNATGWFTVQYSPDDVDDADDATFYDLCQEARNFKLEGGESKSFERNELGDSFELRYIKIIVEDLEQVPYDEGIYVVAFSELAIYKNIVLSSSAYLTSDVDLEDDNHLYDVDGLLSSIGDKLHKVTVINKELSNLTKLKRRAKALLREYTKNNTTMSGTIVYAPHYEVGQTLSVVDNKNSINDNYFIESIANNNGIVSLELARYPRYMALGGQDPGVVRK